jgi:hypothetical protein
MSNPASHPAPPSPGGYPPAESSYPSPAPAPAERNRLAVPGFILAIFLAPIGLVVSLIALIQASKRGQKGKVLAVFGMIIAALEVVVMVIVVVVVFAVGKKVVTVADPGCTQGKTVILANADLGGGSDPAVVKTKLQTLVTGLDGAASQAQHDNVRSAMKELSADYKALLDDLDAGTAPSAGSQDKLTKDAAAIDSLCTIGTSGQ